MNKPFRIDPEFARLHRKLTDEERAGLFVDLKAHGILSPLMVWKEKGILLDGHNRHAWAKSEGTANGKLPIELVSFEDRTAALRWTIRHQLARRNLTPDEASLLRGKVYNLEKGDRPGPKANRRQNDANSRTRERLAKEHGVSAKTIERDGQFAAAVETLEKHVPEIQDIVASGAAVLSKADIIGAAERIETDPEFADELREQLTAPTAPAKPRPKSSKTKDAEDDEDDEDAKREARFNRIRDCAGEMYRASITLEKVGEKARSEYWQSSPTIREISRLALVNLRSNVNAWLQETFDDAT